MANNGIATTDHSIEPIAPFTRSPIATSSNLGEGRECKQWLYQLHRRGDRILPQYR
ncbi:hypothetical protein [Phormidium nigroviride]|uniref:hypothetical protein n=1 Tax=Phormidium nigroviride TaxID=482564 RepID=UPI0002FF239C|nr:hypothetical protein [Oscillatoria nigro-viridis]